MPWFVKEVTLYLETKLLRLFKSIVKRISVSTYTSTTGCARSILVKAHRSDLVDRYRQARLFLGRAFSSNTWASLLFERFHIVNSVSSHIGSPTTVHFWALFTSRLYPRVQNY
jgi:hypothetical protein